MARKSRLDAEGDWPALHAVEEDDEGLAADDFVTRSKDKQGHSHSVRIPDDIFNKTEFIIQQFKPVYRSPQDYLRDAWVHRGDELQGLSWPIPGMRDALATLQISNRVATHAERQTFFTNLEVSFDEIVTHLSASDPALLRNICVAHLADLKNMTQSTRRDGLIAKIRTTLSRFGV